MSDCPVCVGIEGYEIHTCGRVSECDKPMPEDEGEMLKRLSAHLAERDSILQSRITSLESEVARLEGENNKYKSGYKGGCWTCESVGEKNVELAQRNFDQGLQIIQLSEENEALRKAGYGGRGMLTDTELEAAARRLCKLPKGWHIEYNPKPIPDRSHDYDFWHDDVDDGNGLCGTARSIANARRKIEEREATI